MRDGYLDTAGQDPSYKNRVHLRDDQMRNGELSLILNNVKNDDGATYQCHYKERGLRKGGHQIKLSVIVEGVGEFVNVRNDSSMF